MKVYILFGYLLLVSLISVLITVSDKRRAKTGKWRVPEATLLLFSALGGSAAMLITMKKIRHKTKKVKFMVGIPLILIAQIILIGFLWVRQIICFTF
ncbi:MAG: DUF1294 domain-containing protein [Clostridiales bacterium]|nr:DUF1294 domain-containing protein [Clostridiales bacterium]